MSDIKHNTHDIGVSVNDNDTMLYDIYSNISRQSLGEISLTYDQYLILTRAFQHRGILHQDLALLVKSGHIDRRDNNGK